MCVHLRDGAKKAARSALYSVFCMLNKIFTLLLKVYRFVLYYRKSSSNKSSNMYFFLISIMFVT